MFDWQNVGLFLPQRSCKGFTLKIQKDNFKGGLKISTGPDSISLLHRRPAQLLCHSLTKTCTI